MDWVIQELATLSFQDKRTEKRAAKILTKLSSNPSDSIPAASGGSAETKATYRFFDHDDVTPEKIRKTHLDATFSRMREAPIVLLPQDTTVLNFSKQFERKDTGPTTRDSTKGMYLHCAIAVTPQRVCLGAVSVKQWHREALQKLTKDERKVKNNSTPIEEKESFRWLENVRLANEYANELPNTMIVSIADRESDIYDIYEEISIFDNQSNQARAHYLIRAKTDRALIGENGKKTGKKLRETLKGEPPLGHLALSLSRTQKRKPREAHLSVYSKLVHLGRPDKRKNESNNTPVSLTAILCVEEHPPVGEKPIEWLLVTDLPATTFESACEKIQWYTCRWEIEIFFKVLKSGCTIEKLQLVDKNFSTCLSFYLIIAWRLMYVVRIGRESPELSCECVYSKEEWQTTYVVLYRKKPPLEAPSLNEMTRMVASLGGYQNHKSNPEPGVKTLWIGFRNMQEHLRAKEAFEAVYGPTCG